MKLSYYNQSLVRIGSKLLAFDVINTGYRAKRDEQRQG
jgi:hypothetical protein